MNNWILYRAFLSNMLPRIMFHAALFVSRCLCERPWGWFLLAIVWFYINASVTYSITFLYYFGDRMRYHVKYADRGVFRKYSLVLVGGSYLALLLTVLCVIKEMRGLVYNKI